MNNTIKLAVAAALLAGASSANAGIAIPAGDWTLDIGGNVNAYYTSTRLSGSLATAGSSNTVSNITTGLLPNFLSVSGKTRQNDLDVGFTISIQPGAATSTGATLGTINQRQAFMTIGDKSWGSIKLGKDLGIYASDAILSDMTLLGVGQGAQSVGNTTLGRIGAGYMYADWKSQIAYTSPSWNGFSFTGGVTQSWNATASKPATTTPVFAGSGSTSTLRGGSTPAFEGKVAYDFSEAVGNGVTGKISASGITQKVEGMNDRAEAWDIGANVNYAGFGATAFYGQGTGTGQTFLLQDGFDLTKAARDSDDWYVQGTYTIAGVGTKLGLSYGQSNLDGTTADGGGSLKNKMWTLGAYHPLTKHVNLVAEYSDVKNKNNVGGGATVDGKAKTVSLGAILFF